MKFEWAVPKVIQRSLPPFNVGYGSNEINLTFHHEIKDEHRLMLYAFIYANQSKSLLTSERQKNASSIIIFII